MTDRAHPFRHLPEAEALRALYVDFEGEKDEPPVLLGVPRRGGVLVADPRPATSSPEEVDASPRLSYSV